MSLTLTQARAALDTGFVLDLTPPLTLWLREVNPVTGPGEAFSMIFHAPAEPKSSTANLVASKADGLEAAPGPILFCPRIPQE